MTAAIDPGATLADDVKVGDGASLADGVQIGGGSRIGRDVIVEAGVVVGERVEIDDRALVYRGAMIEDGVYIGPAAMLTNDRYPRAIVRVGDVADASQSAIEPVTIRHGASVGAGAVILGGIEIGASAMVAAGAIVTRSVPGHALVAGNPARRLGWVCVCGRRLVDANGDPAPAEPAHYALDKALHCPACGRVYTYVPDAETVEQASGPRTEAPA